MALISIEPTTCKLPDLRLVGACSFANFFAGGQQVLFGETWERLALIKARGVAGDRELAYEFLRQHQPFIYPRSPTPDLLDEIANIKWRIERGPVLGCQ